jgi:hypothetical protein
MRIQLHMSRAQVLWACIAFATLLSVACQRSQTSSPSTSAIQPGGRSTEKVFVEFRGPWAFAPDSKDAGVVLALAPKDLLHHDLYVQASNQSTLSSGVYNLAVPPHASTAAEIIDPTIAHARISEIGLQRALDNKSARFVIRLPKPAAYVVAGRSRSRLGPDYPPDASTERDYATGISLRYDVSSLNGFSLAGTPDNGPSDVLLLQVDTPVIRFVIAPAQDDDPSDRCDLHSRESFHSLTKLFGLVLYVDFPETPAECHQNDPQSAPKTRAGSNRQYPIERNAGSSNSGSAMLRVASLSGTYSGNTAMSSLGHDYRLTYDDHGVTQRFATAVYSFVHPQGDCKAPVIILTPGP